IEQRGTGQNHHGAQDERRQDAPEEDAMLIQRGDAKTGENGYENKDVVNRERLLNQVSGEKLDSRLGAKFPPESAIEKKREPHPDSTPEKRFLEAHGICLSVKDAQIQR